jgi:hypothetical protein
MSQCRADAAMEHVSDDFAAGARAHKTEPTTAAHKILPQPQQKAADRETNAPFYYSNAYYSCFIATTAGTTVLGALNALIADKFTLAPAAVAAAAAAEATVEAGAAIAAQVAGAVQDDIVLPLLLVRLPQWQPLLGR